VSVVLARLAVLCRREPAVIGAVLSAVLPLLVISGAVHLSDQAIATIVVSINAIVGFAVRLAVIPAGKAAGSSAEPTTVG
jgi:hypothetical protein